MTAHTGTSARQMIDMRAVGVGEGIERQPRSGAREHRGDPGHFAGKDRVPSLEKLPIGDVDPERGTQVLEESSVAAFAPSVLPPSLARRKPSDEMRGLAAGMAGPTGHHLAEVDIEHD